MAWIHGELSPSAVPGERFPFCVGEIWGRTNWPQLEKRRELQCSAQEPQNTLVLQGTITASGRNQICLRDGTANFSVLVVVITRSVNTSSK